MGAPVFMPLSQPAPPPGATPTASDPTTAAASAMSNTPVVNSSTKINSLADLKRKAPQVYNMMMQSIIELVRRDMQTHQNNLKRAMRGDGS